MRGEPEMSEDEQLVFYLLFLKEAANAPVEVPESPPSRTSHESDDDWGGDHAEMATEEDRDRSFSPPPASCVYRGAKLLSENATATLKKWLFE